ncbi:short-chain dehydrogenase [Stenotrophomonas sp. ZAC14D2_NAIMI4_7]|uniref:SDR family NAD(P)-dependent oxidoreductase n=1 Tax=Stenotrophomonas sp. ZAC14D2_NAIMI4_7 TaxID=2072405 RepID=UPI000D541C0D|nr:SDR family oxidoreductase [Stenotrophomonas sp. ZAC14D2_NAIMI4_7]AWH19058.1 short-chain dehydrogenase [Stenotrophomonas sp. ZAC14D2_NAIMI4_7]
MHSEHTPRTIALVTGGSRGIGRSIALHLARQGSDVVITYQHQQVQAADTVRQLEACGVRAAMLPLDLAATGTLETFVPAMQAQLQRWGASQFQHLVNNAGLHAPSAFGEIRAEDMDLLYRVHFKGPLLLTQALSPQLADGGAIVNISTSLTRHVAAGSLAYAAMKRALESATRYLALELGARGIAVNAVAPGATETDFFGGAVRDDAGVNQYVAQHTAMGRSGRADDIGAAVANLLAPGSHWITGQRIEVAGGMLL